jgi:hypothetical protein
VAANVAVAVGEADAEADGVGDWVAVATGGPSTMIVPAIQGVCAWQTNLYVPCCPNSHSWFGAGAGTSADVRFFHAGFSGVEPSEAALWMPVPKFQMILSPVVMRTVGCSSLTHVCLTVSEKHGRVPFSTA